MNKLLTLNKIYSKVVRSGANYLKVVVELQDGRDKDFIVDVSIITLDLNLDLLYATAEIDIEDLDRTIIQANKLASHVHERLTKRGWEVEIEKW